MGTGPFKFDSFDPGVQLSLVRNDDYWNPDNEAFLDKVIYRIIPDAQAAAAEFRAGNIDVFPFALTPDILELRDDARFRLLLYATEHVLLSVVQQRHRSVRQSGLSQSAVPCL